MRIKDTPEPKRLDLSKDSGWKVYEWPENDGSISIKLDVEISDGQLFPTPPEGMLGSYFIPDHAIAWGWNNASNSWKELQHFGVFSQEFTYITFSLLNDVAFATANIILFCPIPLDEEEIVESFPPYVEATDFESVIPELFGHNPPEKVTIKECETARELTIHGCGDAMVIVDTGTLFSPVSGDAVTSTLTALAMLSEGAACALKLATFRAQKRLQWQEEQITKNTTCPTRCNFPVLIRVDVTPDFYFATESKISGGRMFFHVTASGRLVERVKIKCKKG